MSEEDRLIARIDAPVSLRDIDAGGLRLRCALAGSGPAILLLHGLNIGWGEWYAVLPALARSHSVIALDFPGSGASSKIDFLTADVPALFLEAVDHALRALAPQGALAVGHSLGAWVAMKHAARRHPLVRGVVAVSPVGLSPRLPLRYWPLAIRPVAELLAERVMAPTRANVERILTDVMADRSSVIPEFVDYVTAHVSRPPVTHPFHLIHRTIEPFRLRRELRLSREELEAIRCPVTVVHGALDPLIPIAGVRSAIGLIPGAKLAVMEGCGHVPPIERPQELAALILEAASVTPR